MTTAAALRVVLVTAPDAKVARQLARALVGERLAACANLVPGVTSIYRWEGQVQQDEEFLLVIKTAQHNLPALERRVNEIHPYEVPEVLALPVVGGSDAYLAWVQTESSI